MFIEVLKKVSSLLLPSTSEDQVFHCEQMISYPVEEVFSFFGDEKNLERITPPWLNFRVLDKSDPKIKKGTLINYRLRVHGIPIQWQSKIIEWEENNKFVDIQTRGPYVKWHHTHTFKPQENGTLMADQIYYQIPGGILGEKILNKRVQKDLESIFSYRRKKIEENFPMPNLG